MKNLIIRRSMCILLTFALFFTGLFCCPITGYGTTITQTVTHYKFITAVVFIWFDGDKWSPTVEGAEHTNPTSAQLDKNATAIHIYPYIKNGLPTIDLNDKSIEGNYYSSAKYYKEHYMPYAATVSIPKEGGYTVHSGKVNYTWKATLNSKNIYDVKETLINGQEQKIRDLCGDSSQLEPFLKALEKDPGEQIKGQMYFVPYIIQYDLEEEVEAPLELEAKLNLPKQGVINEKYNVVDATILPEGGDFKSSTLEKNDGSGWQPVVGWDGRKLGSFIDQSESKEGSVSYLLNVTLESGETDTDSKIINIVDGTVVDATAILSLPEYTYEGHPAIAEDESTFVVDGENYSSLRAYEEGKASNRFSIVESGAGRIHKNSGSDTKATAVFPNKGYYNVQLKVSPKNGGRLYDTKPIEVRKTPTVIATLGGTQKQNRKQVLTIQVATNPDNPLKQLYVDVKNLETGESVHLINRLDGTENTLDNTEGIKTRAIEKLESDQYWTNCQLLFLTKNTKPTEYRYKVYAQDSRGLWDAVDEEFMVQPDLPPDAKISMQDAFFREKGTNTATIEMEDVSHTDGDQLERNWYITEDSNVDENFVGEIEEPAEYKAGFADNSFGTKKIIAVNKIGVGRVKARLHLKDVWTEETLPEYITEEDYLMAETTAITKVDNIAPVVSLKPITPRTADILLLAGNQEEYRKLKNGVNTMQSYFLGNAIDATITVKKLGVPHYTEHGLDYFKQINQGMSSVIDYTDAEINGYAEDSEYLYFIKCTATANEYGRAIFTPPYTLRAINIETGEDVWSYTFDNDTFLIDFSSNGNSGAYGIMLFDNKNQYVYVVRNKKTLLLDRQTGAYLTTLNFEVGKNNFMEGEFIYTFKNDGIYRVNRKNGVVKKVLKTKDTGDAIKEIGSEIHFFTVDEGTKRGIFNPKTEQVRYEQLEKVFDDGAVCSYTGIAIDANGRIITKAWHNYSWYDDKFTVGAQVFSKENTLLCKANRPSYVERLSAVEYFHVEPILDENGECNYLSYTYKHRSKKTERYYVHVYCVCVSDGRTLEYSHYKRHTGYATKNYAMYGCELKNGTVYVVTPATPYGIGGAGGYYEKTKMAKFNFNTGSAEESELSNLGVVYGSRYTKKSNRYVVMKKNQMCYIHQPNLTLDNLIASTMQTHLSKRGDIKLVVLFDESNESNEDAFQNTIQKLKSFGYQFVQITDKIDSCGTKIKDAVSGMAVESKNALSEIAHKIVESKETSSELKLTAKKDGAIFLKSVKLQPYKKYYCEYELKAEDGLSVKAEDLLIKKYNTTTLSDSSFDHETWNVVDSHYETFNNANRIDSFFKLSTTPLTVSGSWDNVRVNWKGRKGYACYLIGSSGRKDKRLYSKSETVKFNIDKDKKGVVSFDWVGQIGGKYADDQESKICIDGQYIYANVMESIGGGGTYMHPILLGEGEHTITLTVWGSGSPYNCLTVIDDLKVDILSKEEKVDNNGNITVRKDKDGYQTVTNEFQAAYKANKYVKLKNTDGGNGNIEEYTTDKSTYIKRFDPNVGKKVVFIAATSHGVSDSTGSFYYHYIKGERDTSVKLKTRRVSSHSGYYPRNNIRSYNGTKQIELPSGCDYYTFTNNRYGNFSDLFFIQSKEVNEITNKKRMVMIDNNTILGETDLYDGNASIGISLPKGTYTLKEFKVYSYEKGKKIYVLNSHFESESSVTNWRKKDVEIEIVAGNKEKEDEDKDKMVYKKGELVAYGISYYDYETDLSKKQFWRYTHTPFNDGVHPDAATILDDDGNVISEDLTKVLNTSIPRFYVDGKYTVEHWQEDNTNRLAPDYKTVDPNGHPLYDKPSNIESLTFYMEGGASAPWITSIKTIPSKVKEGQAFQIQVGVDDAEKDELRLTTEVYKEKKLIYKYKKTGLKSESGVYPLTTTDMVQKAAQSGRYEVVCTVRDATGAGIGTYRFTVVSDGKITGMVNHTDQWDENRKKYNLKRFRDEVNKVIPYAEYIKLKVPRKRGVNVFWSGEKFMLNADVAGSPTKVTCKIDGYPSYITTMKSTGKKNAKNETLYTGFIWDSSMLNKWGRKKPKELTFTFTALYSGGMKKTHSVKIIVDSREDYWQLHRAF